MRGRNKFNAKPQVLEGEGMSEIISVIFIAWAIWASGVMFARWAWRLQFKADLPSEAILCAVVGSWLVGMVWLALHYLSKDERA